MARKPFADGLPGAARAITLAALATLVSACGGGGGDYAAEESVGPRAGPERKFDPDAPTVFGDDGLSLGTVRSSTNIFGGNEEGQGRLPVNKYIWQGALDTLSFLPLASSDPFTGVIATEWGSNPQAPGERFKVTAFVTSPALSAASLRVAVYREVRAEDGQWLPAPASGETAEKLEDAILTRAREIRIAEREGQATG